MIYKFITLISQLQGRFVFVNKLAKFHVTLEKSQKKWYDYKLN